MRKIDMDELLEKHVTDRKVLSEVAELVLKSAGLFAIVGFIVATLPKVEWPYMIGMGLGASILVSLGLMLLMHAAFILADRPKATAAVRFAAILFFVVVIAFSFMGVGYLFLEQEFAKAL